METEIEIWKDVVGFEGLYQVSNLGNVKSLNYLRSGQERILKQNTINKRGCRQVKLFRDGKHYCKQVHRIVAEAFVPNPENKPQVNHINENPSDNRAINLNWMTAKENVNWGTRNERSANSNRGRKVSIVTRQKISNSLMGHEGYGKGKPRSEEVKRKISMTKRMKRLK